MGYQEGNYQEQPNKENALRGGIYFWPRVFSLDSYIEAFKDNEILNGYKITILRTVSGTVLTLLCTERELRVQRKLRRF